MSIGILMFLAVWSGVAGNRMINIYGTILSLASILVFLGGLLFVPYVFRRTDNKLKIYAVTNQRVYVRRGILNIKEKDIPLSKINDVQISRTLIQRFFNAGDIVIQVGNDGSVTRINDINRPLDFRDIIISAIYEDAVVQESKARQQQQEQQQPGYGYNQGYGQQNHYNPQGGGYNQNNYGQQYRGGYDQSYGQGDNRDRDRQDKDYYKNY